jgi:hypothetical protein
MQSGIETEAGDIAESIGDVADGATEVGGTGATGVTGANGPIDLIAGSTACMDVLTGRRVARPTTAGTGGQVSVLEFPSALGGDGSKIAKPLAEEGYSLCQATALRGKLLTLAFSHPHVAAVSH